MVKAYINFLITKRALKPNKRHYLCVYQLVCFYSITLILIWNDLTHDDSNPKNSNIDIRSLDNCQLIRIISY